MGSCIQAWWWAKKWAETIHLCNKSRCAWRNSFGYLCWSEHKRDVSPKDYKLQMLGRTLK